MKKICAAVMALTLVLLLPTVSSAQRRRKRDAVFIGGGAQTGAVVNRKKVVRRVNQARLSDAQIKAIRSLPLLRGVVAVRGTTIRPVAGSSLWQLSNGSYLAIGGGTAEPLASEVYTRDIGFGQLLVWACYCPGYNANKDDGCKFDGPANEISCSQKGGVNCSCKFQDFVISNDGSVIGFEQM